MKRSLMIVTALLTVSAATTAARLSPDEQLAKAIEGRIAGEPVKCIRLRDIRSTRVIDKTAIVYDTLGPTIYVNRPKGLSLDQQGDVVNAVTKLNRIENDVVTDPEIVTRIAQYELAYRMQISVPEVMDVSKEPQSILDLYGAKPGFVSQAESAEDPRIFYKGDDPTFANNCLLARRLVENGVRFVQLYDWGWDHHGSSPGESIDETLPIKCQQTDRAIAGLLIDLEQRGLLNETLVVWSGEFGRTRFAQGSDGRDHNPFGFSLWLAGGGVNGGTIHGQTDEYGYKVVENKAEIHDLHATMLHLLGLDHTRVTFRFSGRDMRLTDVHGHVIKEILA